MLFRVLFSNITKKKKMKFVKDCIYGYIDIPVLCQCFIDVPEFQRLRRVKQLGMVHFVYTSAVHSRFEHSLGVMYLAGKMVEELRSFAPISQRVKELVQLAGLYHDVGHFAYSHLFDKTLNLLARADAPDIFQIREHELRSIYFLQKVNDRLKLLDEPEIRFVAALIKGDILDEKQAFLYQIVCNKECGVDVDKLDYCHRDAFHVNFPAFQAEYILKNVVIDKKNHVAFREKARIDLADLFNTRTKMHMNVYQHHTVLKLNRIHFCMLSKLGVRLFIHGDKTDDSNVDCLIRSCSDLQELVEAIDCRHLDHECDICRDMSLEVQIVPSGELDLIRFV